MENERDDLEVTQDEETFEIEDDVEETTDSVEDEENSTQLHEELKKKEAEIAKLNRLLKKKDKAVEKDGGEATTNKEIERLRLEIKGYEDDQIDFIMSIGGVKALSNPAVKKVADAMKEEKSQLNAQATSKSQSKGSRTYSQAELKAMPLDKLEALIREGKIK
jgi:hypothetical protein